MTKDNLRKKVLILAYSSRRLEFIKKKRKAWHDSRGRKLADLILSVHRK